MRFLNCIEMLNYALKILKHDSRQSVPVGKMGELLGCVRSIEALCKEEQAMDVRTKTTLTDLTAAILSVKNSSAGILTLTDIMKTTLVNGVIEIKEAVVFQAIKYYDVHDFEPTEQNIPLFRDMVQTYFEAGGRFT